MKYTERMRKPLTRNQIDEVIHRLAQTGAEDDHNKPGDFTPLGLAVAQATWPWFCHVDALKFAAECCEQHNAHIECAVALALLDSRNVTRKGRTVTITLPDAWEGFK